MTKYLALLLLAACGTSDTSEPPLFPADYKAQGYQEVRNCRPSIEHGAVNIRVLAAPDAFAAYTGRNAPFSTGAILLKEEYPDSDTQCTGPIKFWTVMQKLDDGSSPSTLDWHWQKVDASRHTIEADDMTCISCHKMCGTPPDGYLNTCTMP